MYDRPYRMLWMLGLAGAAGAVGFLIAGKLKAPAIYDGDRVEKVSCGACGGDGKDEQLAREEPGLSDRCPECGGDGVAELLHPGPNRPTLVRGFVADAATCGPMESYSSAKPEPFGMSQRFREGPPAAAVEGVRVEFNRDDGKHFEQTSGSAGLITLDLPPGRYAVKATRDGFVQVDGILQVARLTKPIPLDEANIVREPDSYEEAQSYYGIGLLVAIPKAGGTGGRIHAEGGMP